jgi:CRISPR-associated protein Cmr3
MPTIPMSKYLITLKPLSPFFFGGENTFGEDNANYFVHSNYLPQQTTLLGMLRYELLAQNDLLGTDPVTEDWKSLIGEKSFEKNNDSFTDKFGCIKNISPVFLIEKGIKYIPQSLDWSTLKDTGMVSPVDVSFDTAADVYTNHFHQKKCPALKTSDGKAYDPKQELKPLWVSSDGNAIRQWDFETDFDNSKGFGNGFFVRKIQTGIHRGKDKSADDEGNFYKQVFCQFKEPDTCFAFYADIDVPTGKEFKSRIMTMGGERSAFSMQAIILNDNTSFTSDFNKATFQTSRSLRKDVIILTSDAYCSVDILTHCDFAITDTIPFRNIMALQEPGMDYTGMSKDKAKKKLFKSTELLYLLKRGSVLFPNEWSKVVKAITNPAFENIGYNKYIEIK